MVYAYAFDVVYTLPIPTNVLRRSFGAYPPAWVWWHDDIIDGIYRYKYIIACVRGEDGTLVSNAHEITRILHIKDVVAKRAIEAALIKREILEAYQIARYGKILDDDYIWSYQSTCLYTLRLDFTDARMWDADDLMVDLSELWGRDIYKSQMRMYKNFGPYQRPFWRELIILGHEKYWWTEMPKQFWMYD